MGQQPGQVGRRILQRHLQRPRIDRAHAKLFRFDIAGIERPGILDDPEQRGILRRRLRRLQAPIGIDEIVGGDRRAVRPDPILQAEGVDCLAGINVNALGQPEHRLAVLAGDIEALEHVSDDDVLPLGRGLVRIQCVGICRDTAPQNLAILLAIAATTGGQRQGRRPESRHCQSLQSFHCCTSSLSRSRRVCQSATRQA